MKKLNTINWGIIGVGDVTEVKSGPAFYKIENSILEEFKKMSNLYNKDISSYNDWDTLSIAQHYGLPTRLLDWTSNPLIALWFAFAEKKDNTDDRVVWGLIVDQDMLVDIKKDNPFNQKFIKVFKPNYIDSRISTQNSWFSIYDPDISLKGSDGLPAINDFRPMDKIEDFDGYLARFTFTDELRKEILNKLDLLGINYNSVFPDLTGLCKNIEWKTFD